MPNPAEVNADNFLAKTLGDLGVGSEPVPAGATPAGASPAPATAPAAASPTSIPAPASAPVAAPVVTPAVQPPAPVGMMAGLAEAALAASSGTPVAEPQVSAPAEEPVPPEAAATEKSRNAWTAIRHENKTFKAKIAELESKLKAGDPEVQQKLQSLQEQVAEYEDKIGRLDLTQSKTFKNKYDLPIEQYRARGAQMLARFTERAPDEAKAFIQELEGADPATVREALAGEPPAVQGAVLQALVDLQEAKSVRDRAISDWRTTKEANVVSASKDEEAEMLRQVVQESNQAVSTLAKTPEEGGEGSWIFSDQLDNPAWQEQKQKITSMARAALRDKIDIPKLVHEGAAAPVYRKLAETLYQENQSLKAALGARDRVRPRAPSRPTGGYTPAPGPGTADPSEFVDSILPQ